VATVFTRIINGEIPARFVWKDDRCVGFLSINPLKPGHTLVVPRQETDHWLDLDPALLAHVAAVSQSIGKAVQRAFKPAKVGLMLAGLEVPHVHFHVVPIWSAHDLDFGNAERNPKPADLDAAARKVRDALRALGRPEVAE
jgi:histidine triad (HIT) family protein